MKSVSDIELRRPSLRLPVGIVVPTLGLRPHYLRECLESIASVGSETHVILVAPQNVDRQVWFRENLINQELEDPGKGLAAAINAGICALPENCEIVAWLGDDDKLMAGSIESSKKAFTSGVVATFGDIDFIDEKSEVFHSLKTHSMAVGMLTWGPNRVPQPGSLLLREALKQVGYLEDTLKWAFDQDLFIRLRSIGKIRHVCETVAHFRWHSESLSAGQGDKSLEEASGVRLMHTSRHLLGIAKVRELLHLFAATRVFPVLDRKLERSKKE